MRRFAFAALLVFLPVQSSAQSLTLAGADSVWARNYAINDTATAMKLMANDFAMTSSNGRLKGRLQELADVRATPGLSLEYFRTRDVHGETLGNTGLVQGVAEWSFTVNGRKTNTVRYYNAVYRRGGALGWELVSLVMRAEPGSASLAPIRWIEGSWRGTGAGVPTFYERYHFQDDSTLIVETLDSTMKNVTDSTRFESRGGFITNRGNAQYVAQLITPDSIVFVPLRNVGNSFVWKRGSVNQWFATIRWPASADKAARERIYTMNR